MDGKSAKLLWLNRNKKTLALNLKTKEAIEIVKDLDQWVEIFKDKDACVEPVLSLDEVIEDDHIKERGLIVEFDL